MRRTPRLPFLVVLIALALGVMPAAILADTSLPKWDNFKSGFTVGAPGSSAKWFYFAAPGFAPGTLFVGDDGIATTDAMGLRVRAAGTVNGHPAFTKTVAQEAESGFPGGFDHVKWLVYMNHFASTGVPGFDALPGQQLVCQSTIGGRSFGNEAHPFGAAVTNPNDDPRLAAIAMNVIDFDTFMVFDIFFTNERIYALYEHLPFARGSFGGPYNEYAAFTYVVPIATRTAGDTRTVAVAYDKQAGVVRWLVDGKEKFRVDRIGYRIDRQHMLLDHGGVDTLFSPNQLDCGMGMFTLLDGHAPQGDAAGSGLVQLSTVPGFYFDPAVGEPEPETWVDAASLASSRLWGEGAELWVRVASVGYLPGVKK
jgi:hypothetical protein